MAEQSERALEEMKLLEGSAGRTKPRTLSPKPYTTLARLGPEELHHVLTHNNTFRTVGGMGRKKRLKWFKQYKQEDNKDNKDNRNMSKGGKKRKARPTPRSWPGLFKTSTYMCTHPYVLEQSHPTSKDPLNHVGFRILRTSRPDFGNSPRGLPAGERSAIRPGRETPVQEEPIRSY